MFHPNSSSPGVPSPTTPIRAQVGKAPSKLPRSRVVQPPATLNDPMQALFRHSKRCLHTPAGGSSHQTVLSSLVQAESDCHCASAVHACRDRYHHAEGVLPA